MAGAIGIASLVGSGLSAIGQLQSAKSEQQSFEMRARLSEMDAAELQQQAKLEQASTQFESEKFRRRLAATQASQRASAAASGVTLSGSTQQFISSSAEEQEMDALMLRFGGMLRQSGLERSADISRLNAGSLRAEGSAARSRGKANAFGTLLSGTANAASTYYSLGGTRGRDFFSTSKRKG